MLSAIGKPWQFVAIIAARCGAHHVGGFVSVEQIEPKEGCGDSESGMCFDLHEELC